MRVRSRRSILGGVARLALGVTLLVVSGVGGLAQTPGIDRVLPYAVAPGQAQTITFFGSGLASPTELWTSFGGRCEPLTNSVQDPGERQSWRVFVPPDASPGIGALRLATVNGVSRWRLIMIDDLPTISATGSNRTASAAQSIRPPIAVDGASGELTSDFYRFTAKRGQRLAVEVVAQRLGSALDPVLRLLDAQGRELAYCDDFPGLGGDARLEYRFGETGDYFVEVRDVRYQGGKDYFYRLRAGDFPLHAVPFPLGAKRGTVAKFSLPGRRAGKELQLQLKMPDATGERFAGLRFARGQGSCAARIAVSDLPEVLEVEPNDAPTNATPFAVPACLNGRFDRSKDRDYFSFSVVKGERLVFNVKTRSLGSPCDVFMRVCRADGSKLADADANGAGEGALTNSFNETGKYLLRLEALDRQGGPDQIYRVEVNRFEPGFTLSVEADRADAAPGGQFELKVACVRSAGFDGPITLSLTGGAGSFQLSDNVISAKTNETTLRVTVPRHLQPGQRIRFGVVGRGQAGGAERAATASTLPALRKEFPELLYPPAALDGAFDLGVTRPEAAKSATAKSSRVTSD